MPNRTDFWGIPHDRISPEILVYSIMSLAVAIMLVRFHRQARLWWQVGRADIRWDKPLVRLSRVSAYAIVQIRVLRQRYSGVMHIALAWSFFVFFLGTALATIDSHFFKFLNGNAYLLYKFVLDVFTIVFIVGAAMAAYRRFIKQPNQLTLKPGFTLSLGLVTIIVASGLVIESLRLAVERPDHATWLPAGWLVAQLWDATGISNKALTDWHTAVWVFHLLTVALTLVTLPGSPLAHGLFGPLAVFFSNIDRPTGQLASIAETPEGEPIYVSSLRDLTWKQLLDGDACTECGRCQDVCPAFAAGTLLNPKELTLCLRDALHRDGDTLAQEDVTAPPLIGETIKEAMLWACTTCYACDQECPLFIEHVTPIVDMRRQLVMQGQMDEMLQGALANLGRYGNSFGQSERARAKWTRGINPKIKDARKETVEYLWFVGDYASYNSSLTNITRKTAEVFNQIGLDFGIMYEGERNAGNDVRRVGEEGLFEMLNEKNQVAFDKSIFESIVTTDPHTYNTLKNEYRLNSGDALPVLHYTQLLDQLFAQGQLNLNKKLDYRVTFHDPCYLGRYNGIYDAPRRVIEATGCTLVEMPRNRDRALCCGAGGGRIWMDEGEVKERSSEARIREAVALDRIDVFVVACPKDITMYRDAIKTTGHEDRLEVKDIIELIHEAL
jgi:Fe-S oxidoreductase